MKKLICMVCALLLLLPGKALAVSGEALDAAVERTTEYVLAEMPQWDDHWLVLALVRSGAALPEDWLEAYHTALEDYVTGVEGVLDSRKHTEYAKAVLGLVAAGYDPTDVAGYDLTAPLRDVEATTRQGVNGAIFALLALDSAGDAGEVGEEYLAFILSRQLSDGGWVLSGQVSDTDMTAMALQALAPYRDREEVSAAIEGAVERLGALQKPDGGFASYGTANSESAAQAILALCALDIPLEDPRFVQGGSSALDALLAYQLPDGSFSHLPEGPANAIATEQALLAMAALGEKWDTLGVRPPAPPPAQPPAESAPEPVEKPRLNPPVPVAGEDKRGEFAIFARFFEDQV